MKTVIAILCIALVLAAQTGGPTSGTTLSRNQMRLTLTVTVSEAVIKVPATGVPFQSYPVTCSGYMEVLRNGLDQTVAVDYNLGPDGLSVVFLMAISPGDLLKIRCFQ